MANPQLIPPTEKVAECLNRLRGLAVNTTICPECLKEIEGREGLEEMISLAKNIARVGVVASIPCTRHMYRLLPVEVPAVPGESGHG